MRVHRVRSLLAMLFATALACATIAALPSVAFAAADDLPPGVAVTMPVVISDSLNLATDSDDYWRVHLVSGQVLQVSIRRDVGDQINVALYRDTGTVTPGALLAYDNLFGDVRSVTWTADATGDYLVDVYCPSGAGTYRAAVYVKTGNSSPADAWDISSFYTVRQMADALTVPDRPAANPLNLYRVYLNAGQTLRATLSAVDEASSSTQLYNGTLLGTWPTATPLTSVLGAGPLSYTAPIAGYYYLIVGTKGGGMATAYTLNTEVLTPSAITLSSSAATVRRPNSFTLSGVLTPAVVGTPVGVEVKKPGKAYWSYSSARLCWALAGGSGAKWWYRYDTKVKATGRWITAGTYYFRVKYAGYPAYGYLGCVSPNTVRVVVR